MVVDNEGASGGMVEGSESKTLTENSSDKGVRVSEVLGGKSITEGVIDGGGKESVESGRMEIDYVSKNQAGDVPSRCNRWDSRGVMNMVERVLGGNFGVDEETEDLNTCEIKQGVVTESTSVNNSEVEIMNNSEVEIIDVEKVKLEDANASEIGCVANVVAVADRDTWEGVTRDPIYVNKSQVEIIVVEKVSPEDVNTSKIGREADVAVDKDAYQGVIREPIFVYKSDTERLVADKDSDDLSFDDLIELGNSLNGEKCLDGLIEGTGINAEEDSDNLVEGTGLYKEKYLDGLVYETGLNGEKYLDSLVDETGLDGEKYLDGLVDETGLNGEKDLDGLIDETSLNREKYLVGLAEGTNLDGEIKYWDGLVQGSGLKKEKDLVSLVEGTSLNGEKYWDGLVEGTGLNVEKDLNGLVEGIGSDGEKDLDYLVGGSGLNTEKDSDDLVVGTGLKGAEDSPCNVLVPDRIMETDEINDVDVATFLVPKTRGDEQLSEKEGEYYMSDLVWGKVKSHPWWPGQIFPTIAASDMAANYIRKQCYLIAYFGDQSFAWNEASSIKPFRKHFSQMVKQSNADGFYYGVSCALDEVARRVEFGLSCPCLSEEVRDKLKLQVVSNAGIEKEKSVIDGGDNLSGTASFLPGRLVQFLVSTAGGPQSKPDRLQFTIAKAQLLAFNRWKGYYELPVFEQYVVLFQDDTQVTVKGEEENDFSSRKRKSTARDGPSTKHRHLSGDKESPMLKEKSLSTLMSSTESLLPNVDAKPVKRARRGSNSVASNSKVKRRKGLLPVSLVGGGEESELVEIIPAEMPTPDVILSKVILSAKVPMQGFSVMISELDFLREFRNLICLETKSKSVNLETAANTSGLEGTEDSYWTDRIIQGCTQEQVLVEPKKDAVVMDLDSEKPLDDSQPTALILNFTNLDNIPPVANLNEIFSRYGPVNESETRILRKSKRVKVIFKRRADAETAFSSSGKYSIFGPALVSYRLNYAPSPTKQTNEGASSKVDA